MAWWWSVLSTRRRSLTKSGARPGDRLVLTKPLGFGVTTTALKRELALPEDVAEVDRLDEAPEPGCRRGWRWSWVCAAATDITGYSLLGHAVKWPRHRVSALRFSFAQVPFVSGARKYAAQWTFPGGAADNRLFFGQQVRFAEELTEKRANAALRPADQRRAAAGSTA